MAGAAGNRRQYVLLGLLGILVIGYFTYGGPSVTVSGETIGDLPPIDIAAVMKGLRDVATVRPENIGPTTHDSVPDRNLFQYGSKTPPPPPPMTEEQRKAEELKLIQIEQDIRRKQQEEQELERQRIAQQQQPPPPDPAQTPPPAEAAPPVPVAPPKPKPPEINFRFVGVIGSPQKKVGVFMNGDKMILARKGEVIDGRFRVSNIGVETADIGYTNPDFKDMIKRLDLGR